MKPKRQSLPQQLPLLARQPILDEQLKVVSYELLCRPMPEDSSKWQTQFGDEATSEVLISTFNDLGIEIVTDRKSTRLNSSHVRISYAVFCLKKKKQSALALPVFQGDPV